MNRVHVNGTIALANGSVMVPPGATTGIDLLGGVLTLQFETVGKEGYKWENWNLTITAPDSPLGIGLEVIMPDLDGNNVKLAFTVHTIGSGRDAFRIVHYLAFRA
jgi:hypothetical protein